MFGADYFPVAILAATVLSVGIGMVWFAPPVLGKRWQGYTGITNPSVKAVVLWAVSYLVLSITMAYLFNHLGVSGVADGLRWGITLGGFVVGLAVVPNYAFGQKPLGLFFIEMGYVFLAVTAIGAILGAWR